MSKLFYQGLGKTSVWPDIHLSFHITYDDVTLFQKPSSISSRREIDLSQKFGPYQLKVPIMSAPMDTVTGERMVRKLAELGGIGVLPRKETEEKELSLIRKLADENVPFVASVGLKTGFEDAERLKENGAQVVLVDVANGGMKQVWELASKIKQKLKLYVMAGNIVSLELAQTYKEAGVDFVRVGVGGGGLCTTREKTGVGYPQLSALFETKESGMFIIADGGISKPGSVAKALAAGADMVMIGSLFGGTDEAPGEVTLRKTKIVRGQASASYMMDNQTELTESRAAEGVEVEVPYRGPVERILNDLTGGLRSSMSYTGAKNLREFYKKSIFVAVSPSSVREGSPHILSDIPGTHLFANHLK